MWSLFGLSSQKSLWSEKPPSSPSPFSFEGEGELIVLSLSSKGEVR